MTTFDILILLLFAAFPVWRYAAAMRGADNRPGVAASAGILLCIALAIGSAAALMAFSLFY